MCGIEEWREKMTSHYMSDNLFYKIADEIIQHRDIIQKVGLYLGNEPLMDKELSNRIKYFKEQNIKVNFSSNASLMDEQKAMEILNSGVDHINFSIDGLDKKSYESIRVHLKFEEVLGNILLFIKLRDRYNFKTAVRISIIKFASYAKSLNDICKFWWKFLDKNKGDSIRLDNYEKEIASNTRKKDIENAGGINESLDVRGIPCWTMWNSMYIKCDGSVALCCVDQCRTFNLGNLKDHSIQEIWKNSKIKSEFKEQHLNYGRGGIDFCKNCIAWST